MITTNTTMTLAHFHDFYYLQALKAQIASELAANPERGYSHAVTKLKNDVDEYLAEFSENVALRTFVYLYAACLGEARHARHSSTRRRFIPETVNRHRVELFIAVSDYKPTQSNLRALVNVFDQEWCGGFGGRAWKAIAEALLDYGKIPNEAWIDHVVDLEHNNGTAFNKSDARNTIYFNTDYDDHFSRFLDYKFRHNILEERYSRYSILGLTFQTYRMVTRFCTLFGKPIPSWVRVANVALKDYDVQWGDGQVHCVEKWYEWIDVTKGNEPNAELLIDKAGLERHYIPALTPNELEKTAKKLKKKCKTIAGKFWNKALNVQVSEKLNKWVFWNKKYCKVEKVAQTYPVLPFITQNSMQGIANILIPMPYQGIGVETKTGFILTVRANLKANSRGWIEKKYGEYKLVTGKEEKWIEKSSSLEALID